MAKRQDYVGIMDSMEKIDKAAYIISLIVERPDLIRGVTFGDPFEKGSIFDEGVRKMLIEISFADDGSIKGSFKKHIEEYESGLMAELERIKQEKNKYD